MSYQLPWRPANSNSNRPASPPNRAKRPNNPNRMTGMTGPGRWGLSLSKTGGVACSSMPEGGLTAATGTGVEVAMRVTLGVGRAEGTGV
jgi:hypothetical protein